MPGRKAGQNWERKHSDETRKKFFDRLVKNGGDVADAARHVSVAVASCRYWLKTVKVEELNEETARVVGRWKGTVDDNLDKVLYKIFDKVNEKLAKATLPDMMKAAKEIIAMKKTLRGNGKTEPEDTDEGGVDSVEEQALAAIQAAENRRKAKSPPLGDKVEEAAGEM